MLNKPLFNSTKPRDIAVSLGLALLALPAFAEQTPEAQTSEASTTSHQKSCRELLTQEKFEKAAEQASLTLTRSAKILAPSERFDALLCRGTAYIEPFRAEVKDGELEAVKRAAEAIGEAQRAANKKAEHDFREALRLAAKSFEPFDVRLVDPLIQLGRLRLAADDADEAELLLLRARDITHRTAGVYNTAQDAVLNDLSEVFMRQNRLQQANRQQVLRLTSAREAYGDSVELIDALHNYARWNASIDRFPKVRVTLEEAVSILENEYGVNDPRLIETLKLRAQLYKSHPTITTPKAGEQAMQRVVDIYSAQEFVDQADLMEARTNMGDWYLLGMSETHQTHRKGIRYYKKTVKQAIKNNVDEELIDQYYGAPKLIFFYTVKKEFHGIGKDDKPMGPGVIKVRYTVGSNGKTRNVQVIEDTLNHAFLTKDVFDRTSTALFRPRFVNGKAVNTPNIEQEFEIVQSGTKLEIGQIYAPVWTSKQ